MKYTFYFTEARLPLAACKIARMMSEEEVNFAFSETEKKIVTEQGEIVYNESKTEAGLGFD